MIFSSLVSRTAPSENPQLLSISTANLESKHAFITKTWGRDLAELEAFPQARHLPRSPHPRSAFSCLLRASLTLDTISTRSRMMTSQALTYSLHYLRARAGFLQARERQPAVKLMRALRLADSLFAKQVRTLSTHLSNLLHLPLSMTFAHLRRRACTSPLRHAGVQGDGG